MRSSAVKPLLGLCPLGKFVFSHEDAMRCKVQTQKLLRKWQIPFVDLDEVLPDGMVRDQAHVAAAVGFFRHRQVAALFMPHCNFGTEGAVGMIGKQVGVPVLLWGPRDEAPLADGTRLRDTLCGLFASSKVLHKLGVPFTYLDNCRFAEPALRAGVERFLAAVNVADVFRRGARIGHIGQRIDFFWTTIVNESELLDRFNLEVRPVDLVEFIRDVKALAVKKRAAYRKEIAGFRRRMRVEGQDDATFAHILAVRDRVLELAERHGFDAIALQDFNSLADELGTWCFFANSLISEVMPMSCESDIHGAISTLLLHRAQFGTQPVNFSEFTIRHPTDDNGVLMWHAGAPLSICRPGAKPRLGTHWILPNPVPGMTHWPLKDGNLTILRFDGDRGDYALGVGEGVTMPGPDTQNNYLWMKVRNWRNWERALIHGPFIHHVAMAYGHVGHVVREACRFLPGVRLTEFAQPEPGAEGNG